MPLRTPSWKPPAAWPGPNVTVFTGHGEHPQNTCRSMCAAHQHTDGRPLACVTETRPGSTAHVASWTDSLTAQAPRAGREWPPRSGSAAAPAAPAPHRGAAPAPHVHTHTSEVRTRWVRTWDRPGPPRPLLPEGREAGSGSLGSLASLTSRLCRNEKWLAVRRCNSLWSEAGEGNAQRQRESRNLSADRGPTPQSNLGCAPRPRQSPQDFEQNLGLLHAEKLFCGESSPLGRNTATRTRPHPSQGRGAGAGGWAFPGRAAE